LIVVEFSDLIFAVDSIPAIFAITADPFLVFTSNIFAILGLRSLYFALAGLLDRFRYLNKAIGVVIVIVGAKMLAQTWLHAVLGRHANFYLLGVILLVLAIGIVASMRANARDRSQADRH
ncbi:MAG TPA: TerC family protein, partial [Pseudomonadales bacterium]